MCDGWGGGEGGVTEMSGFKINFLGIIAAYELSSDILYGHIYRILSNYVFNEYTHILLDFFFYLPYRE